MKLAVILAALLVLVGSSAHAVPDSLILKIVINSDGEYNIDNDSNAAQAGCLNDSELVPMDYTTLVAIDKLAVGHYTCTGTFRTMTQASDECMVYKIKSCKLQ